VRTGANALRVSEGLRQPHAAPPVSNVHRAATLATAAAQSVLVVENDPEQRQSVAAQLARWGYGPVQVSSAEEALALLGRARFAFSVVAIRLPGMSGIDLLRRATPGTEAGGGIGAVLIVADDQHGAEVAQAIHAGADDFIRRSYLAEDLENSVKGLSAKLRGVTMAPAADENVGRASLSLKEISRRAVQEAEREAIRRSLEQCHWNRVKTAKLLKISYRALLYKIKDMGLKQG
jgi:DNA-binding NtrC family response regulator